MSDSYYVFLAPKALAPTWDEPNLLPHHGAVFAATMPPHVNITEMLVVPTYMRLIAPNARKVAAMP